MIELIETIPKYNPDTWVMCLIGGLVFAAFIVGCKVSDTNWHPVPVTINCIIIVSAIVLLILVLCGNFNHLSHNEYVIRCGDDVSINEIYEKYDVVKKEKYSNVYTVKLRD